RLDHYMGDDMNEACDNLWFTLLFKRLELCSVDYTEDFSKSVSVFRAVMAGRPSLDVDQIAWVRNLAMVDRLQHDAAWLRQRVASLLAATVSGRPRGERWGWKEPNTHVFLDRLQTAFPEMKYIHVMRNGLDMAYSENQNQLKLWGSVFLDGSS